MRHPKRKTVRCLAGVPIFVQSQTEVSNTMEGIKEEALVALTGIEPVFQP